MFGGVGGSRLEDLWGYRPAEGNWAKIPASGPGPPTGNGHSAVWDPGGDQLLVYGGFGGSESAGLWAFQPAAGRWRDLETAGTIPSPQSYHTAVWDSAAGRMLVFGGIGPTFGLINDLWAYAPSTNTWLRLDPDNPPPPPLLLHAAVWDPDLAQMLVYGGVDPVGGKPTDQLWSYRPASNTWSRLISDSPSPPARLSAGAVWDPIGHRLLILSGSCGSDCFLDDVWSYRPAENRWTELPAVGRRPRPRAGLSAVWDPVRGQVVVFGGSTGSDLFNDVWTYRPATYRWEASQPLVRSSSQTFTPAGVWMDRQRLFALDLMADRLRLYDLETGTWSAWPVEPGPGPRQEPTLVWDPDGQRALLFGGYWEGRFFADLWELAPDRAAWRLLRPLGRPPPARFRHSAVWDPAQKQLLVFGGRNASGDLDDTWRYDATANRWEELGPVALRPAPRSHHSAVWDPIARRMIVSGGLHGDPLRDLWSFDPSTATWSRLPSQTSLSGAFGHGSVWDSRRDQLVITGGTGSGARGQVWSYRTTGAGWRRASDGREFRGHAVGPPAWDPSSRQIFLFAQPEVGAEPWLWTFRVESATWGRVNLRPAAPTSRTGHSVIWRESKREALLFGGGRGPAHLMGDLWNYTALTGSWTSISAQGSSPPPRADHAAAWDEAGQRMFVFGGRGVGGPLADLWVLDGTTHRWRQTETTGPSPGPRQEHVAVWDDTRHRLLVYGGVRDGAALGDLWSFDPATNAWAQLVSAQDGPPGRYRLAAAWDRTAARLWILGGYGGAFPGAYLDDLWMFDTAQEHWIQIGASPPWPKPRARHGAVWDVGRRRLLVFGGFAGGVDYLSDLWAFDAATAAWSELPGGSPRAGHGTVWDDAAGRLLIVGGQASGMYHEMATYQAE